MSTTDKSAWGDGPWRHEPDRVEWRVGELYCLVNRSPLGGNLNGYVGVPPAHPWHGKDYDDIECQCHGGLAFSKMPEMWDFSPHCPAGYWIVGFDCAHSGDLQPAMRARMPNFAFTGDAYRDLAYVTERVFELVEQAIRGRPITVPPGVLGLSVTGGVARFEHYQLWAEGGGMRRIAASVPVTGGGQKVVEDYVWGLIPLDIVADWLYEHQDEVGLEGIDDLHGRIMAFSLPRIEKTPS